MARARHDADDARREAERVARADQSADAGAAADRHVDGVEVGDGAEELERVGGDAGDELALERSDEFAGPPLAREPAAYTRASSKSRPCSISSAPSARIAAFFSTELPKGHDDHAAQAVAPGGEREALAVVAARCADHARRARRARRELRDEVEPAAHLERAGRRVVLVLHPDLAAGAPGDERPGVLRRGGHRRVHAARGGFDGGEIDHDGRRGKRRLTTPTSSVINRRHGPETGIEEILS